MRYCLIENGIVVSTILWDGEAALALADGITVLPESECAELPRPVPALDSPSAATPRQIRLALLSRGITPEMISGMLAGNPAGLIEWEYSLEVLRDHPLVATMAVALGMDEAAVGALFAEASQL